MMGTEVALVSFALLIVAMLYSSVGHGGASGYLAVMSLATIATMEAAWLKQHAWSLNLVVSAIAFYHFRKGGHHIIRVSIPFVLGGVPFAFLGGYLAIDGGAYDTILSVVLLLAAIRLVIPQKTERSNDSKSHGFLFCVLLGMGIGFVSGIVGIGGGVLLSPFLIVSSLGSPKEASATSALFIWFNSLSGMIGSFASSGVVLEAWTVLPFATAVFTGAWFGSRYGSESASERGVSVLLAAVLMVAASKRALVLI